MKHENSSERVETPELMRIVESWESVELEDAREVNEKHSRGQWSQVLSQEFMKPENSCKIMEMTWNYAYVYENLGTL